MNLVALSINFVSAVSDGHAPLTVVQLLWVNMIMDTMGALALATEPPREELMQQAPYGKLLALHASNVLMLYHHSRHVPRTMHIRPMDPSRRICVPSHLAVAAAIVTTPLTFDAKRTVPSAGRS